MALTVNQPTSAPTAKVAAVGLAGLIITAIIGILASFGVIVPDGLSDQASQAVGATVTIVAAIQAIVQFFAGYLKKAQVKDVQ